MLKVIETFSGIGAQAKALKNIGCEFEIIGTADWDINAIIAYDLIHHGPQDTSKYDDATREDMLKKLRTHTLSSNGKVASKRLVIQRLGIEVLRRLCAAIDRTNNYVSVTDIDGAFLPSEMNTLTYSFPCQDLSVAHAWHGESGGINRNAVNRSSMLWQIERILKEREASPESMPKFLLMENVPNIISRSHNSNFEDWKQSLEKLGYFNKFYVLNSNHFGTPQIRKRAYLISVYIDGDIGLKDRLQEYFENNDLSKIRKQPLDLSNFLRTDYSKNVLSEEANSSQPNDTPSRREIFKKGLKLFDGREYSGHVKTITTKQDRHPNAGIITYDNGRIGKANYRYLTGRECMLLMGFEDRDYEAIVSGNFRKNIIDYIFNNNKIVKMAGNSIVVPVLEEIFKQLVYIDKYIFVEVKASDISYTKEKIRKLRYAVSS